MPIRLTVLGTGYLGATHAACMAEMGHDVLGIDVDPTRVASLQAAKAPFFEPGLDALLERGIRSGRLRFSTSYPDAAAWSDVHFLCVGTPQMRGAYSADLRSVESAVTTLASLANRSALLIGKSTVPVGTAERLSTLVRRSSSDGALLEVAWNPEFLREGHAVADTLHPDRIVLGIEQHGRAEAVARLIYGEQIARQTPFIVTDLVTAEMVKSAANAFLATKISFINAMAELCEASGADVTVLADSLGHDERIGRQFLNAGLGFGGGCLPKDIRAFIARADELDRGDALGFLREVDNINMRSRARMVDATRDICGGSLAGRRIAVLGTAFKPNSDDVRDSPALEVAHQLQLLGATVTAYDPKAMYNSRKQFPMLEYGSSVGEACTDADAVLVLTEWSSFTELTPVDLEPHVRETNILDGRNCLEPAVWQAAGWTYRSLGRGRGLSTIATRL
ncbi:UDP-glucose dehydrogenase family protein [Nocardia gipuzkoensis]